MPLVFNGVTIPENVANAFSFNGANVTDVYFNGVQVWHQSLFSGLWSGNSMDSIAGIQTSGNAYRYQYNTSAWGPWLYTNQSGLGVSGASVVSGVGIGTDGNNNIYIRDGGGYTGLVNFDTNSKFTGGSQGAQNGYVKLVTSGGLLQHQRYQFGWFYGAWISLT